MPDSTQERLLNFFPQRMTRESKEAYALIGTPGLSLFGTIGADIRGQHVMAGVLYVVAGGYLYSVSPTGVKTQIGVIPGIDLVVMADSGAQLGIAANGKGYIYTLSTGVLAEITDPDFPAGIESVTWQDGYFLWSCGLGQFAWSAVNDGTDYDALDFATAEANPDGIVRAISDHRQVMMLGQETVEVYRNTGGDPPFRRASDISLEIGCAGKHAVAKFDNTLVWVDNKMRVVRLTGSAYQVISTAPVAKAIEETSDASLCVASVYGVDGNEFYSLHIPDSTTFTYSAAAGEWFEQKSQDRTAWRVEHVARCYDKWLGLGDQKIYEIDPDVYSEDGAEIIREAIFPYLHAENRAVRHNQFEVVFRRGVGLTTGQGSDPQAMMQYSDNGGRTWSSEIWRGVGKIGEYAHRAYWNRLGRSRHRIYRVRTSDPVEWQIAGAFVEVSLGR